MTIYTHKTLSSFCLNFVLTMGYTLVGTSVGMIPIALEWAIGLERLSPMAIVAIGGLMVSTFLTMVYVPILYSLFEDARVFIVRLFHREPAHEVHA